MPLTLLVDDNTEFRQLLRRTLRNRFPSMMIEEAADAGSALKKIEQLSPQLIFVDIHLPDGNGLTLVKQVKITYPKIIIIVLTGYNIPEYRDAAIQSGALHFFTKSSLTSNVIEELVESILPAINRPDGISRTAE